MENDIIPITMTKKIWNLVQVILQMARKGTSSKRKLLLGLDLMIKRGKIASKALVGNLMFHHHRPQKRQQYSSSRAQTLSSKSGYEFSCRDTPAHHTMFDFIHHHLPALQVGGNKHKKGNKNGEVDMVEATSKECPDLFLDDENYEAVNRVLDALTVQEDDQEAAGALSSSSNLNHPASYYSSPAAHTLMGLRFGRSPRQLRVTNSPFPALTNNNEDDRHVDEAAEDFINRFYIQLRQQKLTPGPHGAEW